MKIAFDAKRAFHNHRGLGNYSRTLIDGLGKSFPNNEYLLFTPPVKDPHFHNWGKNLKSCEVVSPDGLVGKMFPSFWRSLFLNSELEDRDIDIFHGLSHELPPGIHKRNMAKIVTIHDLLFMRLPENFFWLDRLIYKKKFEYSAKAADLIVTISQQSKQDIMEYLKVPEEKIRVVYQSCNPLFQVPYNPRSELTDQLPDKYILYVGALSEGKNVLALLEAFAKQERCKDYILLIVGRGESYKKKMIQRALELKVSERLLFLTADHVENVVPIYKNASLFVFPSLFEGFGIPVIEAQFLGVPVITSSGSCLEEAGGIAAKYIDPNNTDHLSEVMGEVLASQIIREKMISDGYINAQKFSLENTSKSLMSIYQEVLDSNRSNITT